MFCPCCFLLRPKLVWATGCRGVCDGHFTVQVQVQGLKDNSQQLVLDGWGRGDLHSVDVRAESEKRA